MKILLVGSSGFIGQRLEIALSKAGHTVWGTSRGNQFRRIQCIPYSQMDICDLEIDFIVNAAGKYSIQNDNQMVVSNVGVAKSIALSAPLVSKGVINLSSYFQLMPVGSRENSYLYTQTKQEASEILQKAAKLNGLNFSDIFLFDNFDVDLSRKKFFDLVVLAALNQSVLKITNIEKILNILPVPEIVSGIVALVDNYSKFQHITRFDFKNSTNLSIKEIIKSVEDCLKKGVNYEDLGHPEDTFKSSVLEEQTYRFPHTPFELSLDVHLEKMNFRHAFQK